MNGTRPRRRWRGGGHQQQVAVRVSGQAFDQLVAQVPSPAVLGRERAGVRLIHDYQLGAGAGELVAAPAGLDVLGRNYYKGIDVEERLARRSAPFQPAHRARQHQLGRDVELLRQLGLPLLGQVRRAEDSQPAHLAPVEQFPRHQRRLDGLADAHIVGDQQADRVELERHQQRHKLVGPRLDRNAAEGAERSCTGAESQAHRIAQQPARAVIAGSGRIGQLERRWPHLRPFQRQVDPGDLPIGAAQRP